MSNISYIAETARTGQAKCQNKECKKGKIEKGILRIGAIVPGPSSHSMTKWYHPECFSKFRVKKGWWAANCPDVDDIEGMDDLSKKNREIVEDIISELKGGTPASKKPKKAKDESDDEEGSEEEEGSGGEDEGSADKDNSGGEESDQQIGSSEGSEPEEEESSDEEPAGRKRKPKASPKAKKSAKKSPKASTPRSSVSSSSPVPKEKIEKIQQAQEDLSSKTVNYLKECLRKNNQKISGKKQELVDRVAECQVLGCIPKCPDCGGGNPVFDINTGTYKCYGYFDEAHVHCSSTFNFDDITRTPWEASK